MANMEFLLKSYPWELATAQRNRCQRMRAAGSMDADQQGAQLHHTLHDTVASGHSQNRFAVDT